MNPNQNQGLQYLGVLSMCFVSLHILQRGEAYYYMDLFPEVFLPFSTCLFNLNNPMPENRGQI